MAEVVVSISDKYLWCLKPFAYCFNKYWSPDQEVMVAGYKPPDFELPDNFKFISIRADQYDKDHWVDGMIDFIPNIKGKSFVLLLEDYWLCRKVDTYAIDAVSLYMDYNLDVLRFDMCTDRLYAGGMRDIEYYLHYDIIEAVGSQYQVSLQASFWNKFLFDKLCRSLPEGKRSAWEFEMYGTEIVNRKFDEDGSLHVFGMRQFPIRYVNAMNNDTGFNTGLSLMAQEDVDVIMSMIPEGVKGEQST